MGSELQSRWQGEGDSERRGAEGSGGERRGAEGSGGERRGAEARDRAVGARLAIPGRSPLMGEMAGGGDRGFCCVRTGGSECAEGSLSSWSRFAALRPHDRAPRPAIEGKKGRESEAERGEGMESGGKRKRAEWESERRGSEGNGGAGSCGRERGLRSLAGRLW